MKHSALTILSAILLTGCSLDIGDLNNPSEEQLQKNPTPTLVAAAATGLLIGSRTDFAQSNGYTAHLGILGRESYNFDGADPRFRTEMLSGPGLNPGSPAFGGNLWDNPYANIHNANNLLAALNIVEGLSQQEIEATRGYAKTIQALDYLMVINTRDENGAALATSTSIDELPPLVGKDEIFAHIVKLLDEGRNHLQSGGDAFPFKLSSGFAGFDTPGTFLRFNRALRARVAVYTEDHEAALEALDESFVTANPDAPALGLGVYHVYSTLSGDSQNELISNNLYAHPSVIDDAEEGDVRVSEKLGLLDEARTQDGLSSDVVFTLHDSVSSPVPIIRNEELILLRAEASFYEGDLEEAIADLNFIREHSGDLAPRDDLDADNFEDELAYQRRYGLLFEGHRWIDMRRWGRLDELPLDREGDVVHTAFPIPTPELDARQ